MCIQVHVVSKYLCGLVSKRIAKEQSKRNNPEKLATQGTQEEEKQSKHNTICVGHHYTQTNTYDVNKTWVLLQTTGGKDEQNIVFFYRNRKGHNNTTTQNSERKDT